MSLRSLYIVPLRALHSPALLFFALPWLMGLLVLGTVAQRYIGLYAAQKLFFGSFILWAGLVPLPGAYAVLTLISLSLFVKLAYKPVWTRRRLGTLIVHGSILLLLLGGLVSALGRQDGYMVLADAEQSASVLDYQRVALEVKRNNDTIATYPIDKAWIEGPALPFKLHVARVCYPCASQARTGMPGDRRGLAAKIDLLTVPAKPEESRNLHGAELRVSGAGVENGTYIAFDGLAQPEGFRVGKDRYTLALHPAERILPFNLRLLHFTKSDYPGTEEARSYRSDVTVRDGALTWSAAIEMNSPLRYKGYTVYQSSFVAREDGSLQSVLSVVKNSGEWFPYISITLLCAGLLLHIALILWDKRAISPRILAGKKAI